MSYGNSNLKNSKTQIILLQLGALFEYFDLMLYVHLAFVLDDLFFPPAEGTNAQLISAIAFCSTFVFKPFGAIILGYVGDKIGRKFTTLVGIFSVAFCSLTMAILPSYAQIGISAAIILTLCRMTLSLFSMGEKIGTDIYLAEISTKSMRNVIVCTAGIAAGFGSTLSLGIGLILIEQSLNWRLAFVFGGILAIVGLIARKKLKESGVFVYAKKQEVQTPAKEANWKVLVSYFCIDSVWPAIFYFVYIYCMGKLRNDFNYSAAEIIRHNFFISVTELFSLIAMTIMVYRIYPLVILKIKLVFFIIFTFTLPWIINYISTPGELFCIQILLVIFAPTIFPAAALFIEHFPILTRFSRIAIICALSRAIMYPISSFGFIYLIDNFGYWGTLFINVPLFIGYALGLNYFEKISKSSQYS
ncbi:MAG: MFS transporter [Rickettsiaceae bacterium]|nr:MFS transporter [Rickettsiaceae bacterium]